MVFFGITRLIYASFGITRLICASFGITRLLCVSFGITRLICASFGITRLICSSFEITRLICASDGITRLIDGNTVDAAAGGALADKTPTEARELISRRAKNSQSFGNRASKLDNSLTKEVIEDVNIVQRYDPHGNTYNSGWRDNPNLRWGNDNQKHTQAPPTSSNEGTNLEDIIKALATTTLSFQQEMKQQMTQLTTAISKMDGKGKLPAQPDHANVSVISLRSGKILDTPTTKEKKVTSKPLPLNSKNESREENVETNPLPFNSKMDKSPLNDFTPYIPKLPFPSRLAPKNKEAPKEEELLDMFRKVQINLPLLDAI
ncbi:retrotransposon gag protein [Cucumis melo var. makuwa]|uniref:Retrotransposon gag protein n=1 Tax=Cucumis melo var. makuwa TaxID=1194695 RepID=A0A5A7V0M2_CUCMM|nr:retrotransposon gag protein [Cucumis melo var. makuwa]